MKNFKLLTALELMELNKEYLYEYIDNLHLILKDYQIIIDMSISKNRDLNG